MPKGHKFVDMKGQKIGRLEVVENAGKVDGKAYYWKCLCKCGKETIVKGTSLRYGSTQSCGCLNEEINATKSLKHGGARKNGNTEPLYNVYKAMLQRCYNSNNKHYIHYGARGISVCDEWLGEQGYSNFKEWAYKNEYKIIKDNKGRKINTLSIDRINNDDGYNAINCRIADRSMQGANKVNRSKTGHRGIYQLKSGAYYSKIQVYNKAIYLGCHKDINNAIKARKKAEIDYYGILS